MKKITLLTAFFVAVTGFSQSSKQKIQTYLDNNREKLRLTTQDVSDWVIESEVPGSGTGITSTYVVQRHQGIEVFNAQSNVWIKGGSVLNMESNFRANVASRVNTTTPNLTVLQAIASAYSKVGVTKPTNFTIVETLSNKTFKLNDGIDLEEVISAKLVYQTTKENQLNLAWGFQFYSPANGDLLDLRVDALTGAILEKNNLTISCNFGNHDHLASEKKAIFSFEKSVWNNSKAITAAAPGTPGQYRVIPYNYTSPSHSPFELITTTGNLLACPNGWHDSNTLVGTNAALKFTYTRGNNVWAKSDPTGDNETTVDPNVDGTAALTFDFPYGLQTSLPTTYSQASTTNLFYMNNIMHDVWYQYGFTEAAGNFQKDNYGRAGTGGAVSSATGDYVFADAQDGYSQATATLNNANFSTPNDGSRPRMQMFLWNAGAPPTNYITINGTSPIAGPLAATTNVFEGTDRIAVPGAPNGITSDLVLYTNAPNPLPTNAVISNSALREIVGADALATIATTNLQTARLGLHRILLGTLVVEQFGFQQTHRACTVFMLATLVLAFHHHTGRNMGDANGRIGFVNVLAARTGGAKGVCTNIIGRNLNVINGIHFGQNRHGGGRRVDATLCLGIRYALHPVRARFEFEAGERALALNAGNDFAVTAMLAKIG